MMTLRSCPDLRPMVVRRRAPHPRLLDVVHRARPPLSRFSARWTRHAACTNHGGGCLGGFGAAVLIADPSRMGNAPR